MSWIPFPYGLLVFSKPPTFPKIKQRDLKNTSILMSSLWDVIVMCTRNNCDCCCLTRVPHEAQQTCLYTSPKLDNLRLLLLPLQLLSLLCLQHSNGTRVQEKSNWWPWWWEKKGVQVMVCCWKGMKINLQIFYKD